MIGIPVPARSLGASHVCTEWTLWAGRTHTASVWSLRGWTDGRTDGERDTRGCRQSDHTHHGAAAGVKTKGKHTKNHIVENTNRMQEFQIISGPKNGCGSSG